MSRMGRNPFRQARPARPETAAPGASGPARVDSPELAGLQSARSSAAKLLTWAATEVPAQGVLLAIKTVGFFAGLKNSGKR